MINQNDYKIGSANEFGIDKKEIRRFYTENWGGSTVLSIPSFYEWQFYDAPGNNKCDACCLAVNKQDYIVGVMGVNGRSFCLNKKFCKGGELTSWIISNRERGHGIGGAMIGYLKNHYDVLFGTGISEQALSVYILSGFNYLRYVPRFIRVYDSRAICPYAKINKLGEKIIEQRKEKIQFLNCGKNSIKEVSATELVNTIGNLSDNFNYFVRDNLYLKWRYDCHPAFNYHSFKVGSAGIVFRVDTIQNLKIAHIVDIFSAVNDDIFFLINFIDTFCNNNNIHVVDFYCTTPLISHYFVAAGWFSVIDDYYFQFAHLFYPPKLCIPPTTSLIYWSRNNASELSNMAKLYITKSDIDLDRPTQFYYNKHTSIVENN